MNSYDHYFEARKLAKLLEPDGSAALAEEVLDAMVVGATGTEIFMLLRVAVRKALTSSNLSAETTQVAQTLLSHLEQALR